MCAHSFLVYDRITTASLLLCTMTWQACHLIAIWVLSEPQHTFCQLLHSTCIVSNYTLQLTMVPLFYNIITLCQVTLCPATSFSTEETLSDPLQ